MAQTIGGNRRKILQQGKVISMYYYEGRAAGEYNGNKYSAIPPTWRACCVYGFAFDKKYGFSNGGFATFDITEEQHNKLNYNSDVDCVIEILKDSDKGIELIVK